MAPALSINDIGMLTKLYSKLASNFKIICATVILFSCVSPAIYSQTNKNLVQFTGVVVTSDSLRPVPFASVMVARSGTGTFTDYYGFFSFVARKGDTIHFSCLGFKDAGYIIPDTLVDNRYSLIQTLIGDTVSIPTITIMPWPTKEDFKQAFLNLKINDNDFIRANHNMDPRTLAEISEFIAPDGSINYKWAVAQQQTRLYQSGQYPSFSIMNPIAWAKFIEAWKTGAFKQKK